MIPSSSSTARRTTQSSARRRRRRNNAAAASAIRLRGSGGASASARALAAGLWRLRHASVSAAAQTQAPQKLKARRREACHHLCNGNRRRHLAAGTAAGSHCQCVHSRNHHYRGILDKIDACVELEWPPAACCAANSSMEKATKWDGAADDIIFASHSHSHQHHRSAASSPSPLLVLMEAELEKARGQVSELEEERRVMTKRLERFLRRLSEEKAAWKARVRDKARRAVAALSEDLSNERRHRRQLEQANAKLLRELAEARSSVKQQAQSYETERKARELMEEACSELTREVEEDQAEVELLRRECLRMREDMEEERRMLQMAEVWREERVQMKLSDAKLALESKYTQLNRLQVPRRRPTAAAAAGGCGLGVRALPTQGEQQQQGRRAKAQQPRRVVQIQFQFQFQHQQRAAVREPRHRPLLGQHRRRRRPGDGIRRRPGLFLQLGGHQRPLGGFDSQRKRHGHGGSFVRREPAFVGEEQYRADTQALEIGNHREQGQDRRREGKRLVTGIGQEVERSSSSSSSSSAGGGGCRRAAWLLVVRLRMDIAATAWAWAWAWQAEPQGEAHGGQNGRSEAAPCGEAKTMIMLQGQNMALAY